MKLFTCLLSILFFSGLIAQNTFQSDLPIINIDTKGQGIPDVTYIKAGMGIIYNGPGQKNASDGSANHFSGSVSLSLHGSSSNTYSPKKSYSFKIINNAGIATDISILGLPAEHSFVLIASYFDKTFLRNTLTYRLFGYMGHYSPRTKYVELILNGQYQGLYILIEKIKRGKDRVDISKLDKKDLSGQDLTGGYIIKIDRVDKGGGDGWYSKYKKDIRDSLPAYFQYDYPDYDSIQAEQKEYIKNYINEFDELMNRSDIKGYGNYIDVNSFVDKILINEMAKNVDGYRLSEYIYKEKDLSWRPGYIFDGPAWDYDIAWANANYGNSNDETRWQYKEREGAFYSPGWWRRLMEDPYFKDKLYCRYNQFRKTFLKDENIYKYIDSTALALAEPLQRNYNRWPTMKDTLHFSPLPIPGSYNGELDVLKGWIARRLKWMDANIQGVCRPEFSAINYAEAGSKSIVPNPFTDVVKISLGSNDNGGYKINVYNIVGARVFSDNLAAGQSSKDISLKGLKTGMYLLELSKGEEKWVRKLIKTD